MRRMLDSLYLFTGVLGAFFLLMIGVLIAAQIVGRAFDVLVPSADDFARLSLAASSFLALGYTYRRGVHIRVNLLLQRLAPGKRRFAELTCLLIGTWLTAMLAWFTIDMTIEGIRWPEYTIGLIPIPKWIPQIAMSLGAVVLFIAFLDDLVVMLRGGQPGYLQSELSADDSDRHAAYE
jgi:TRAP-type C4-dicarboxylate transport system permease small subunit